MHDLFFLSTSQLSQTWGDSRSEETIIGSREPETIYKILKLSETKARQTIKGNPERTLKVPQPARQKTEGLAYQQAGRSVLPPKRAIGIIQEEKKSTRNSKCRIHAKTCTCVT